MKKAIPSVALLLFVVFLLTKFLKPNDNNVPVITDNNNGSHQTEIPLDAHLIYTKHARCRMQCRQIDESEIQEIISSGTENKNKSNTKSQPCPTIALEGTSHDNQQLRIVFAKCDDEIKVVTCIDLTNDFECDCN